MKILVSAGEVSGDVHGASLVKELKKLRPHIHFFGMGSEKLAAEGVDVRLDITRRGTIGIFEALPNIFPIYFTFQKMKSMLLKEKPDLVLLIDSQGFNMPLARFCKRAGFKTAYYIAPQEWMWGTESGIRKVAENIDLIVAVFKKEYDIYQKAGGNVVYFGHPLIDIVKPSLATEKARKLSALSNAKPVISICPGSRSQEIRGVFPILLKSAELIKKELPDAKFIFPVASSQIADEIVSRFGVIRSDIVIGQTYDALSASSLAICVSGTINLEASLLGVPNIMVYKLSSLTYFIGKYILKIGEKLRFFSVPNMLLNQKVIPELIMADANPRRIADEALSILCDPIRQKTICDSFKILKIMLGSPGVISRCARSILEIV